jgi:hypothetical protein
MPITIKGTVRWSDNEERVQGALVKAVSQKAKPDDRPALDTTDDNGGYVLAGLEKGEWKLLVFHENAAPEDAQEHTFEADENVLPLVVRRYLGAHDERAGRWFFIALCIALGALLLLYAGLHLAFPYRNAPVSELLLGQVDQAVSRAISLPVGAKPAENLQLVEAVAAVKSTWNTISGTQVALGPADREVFTGRLAEIEKAIAGNDAAAVKAGLTGLRGLVENPPSRGLFWTREPFRYLEVFFWGLAGILVALILSSGNYLRWRHFYREGIWQHIAQIVTIPLLALVVVLLLSQVTVAITLANSTGLQINLSDPRLLAAVAFLIGVQPWDTWRFVRETAGQITGRTQRQR